MLVLIQFRSFVASFSTKPNKTMKHFITNLIIWGAMLLCPSITRAEPYSLEYRSFYSDQRHLNGSKAPQRPLIIDVTNNILTVPNQVVGYTLTLEGEDNDVYTNYIINTTFTLPQELCGKYTITIFDGNSTYQGYINIK